MNTITREERRKRRVRARVKGTEERPRLSVFRSNRRIALQIIDDRTHTTLAYCDDRDLAGKKAIQTVQKAKELGAIMAKRALEKNIRRVVFDRGGYAYHGALRAIAEGAREGGLDL